MLRAVRDLSTAALLIIILVVVGGLVFLFVPLASVRPPAVKVNCSHHL